MKIGLFGQQLTLMEELKAETFAAHARLQSAPLFTALAGCQLPLESYVGQLRTLAVIHGALEQALDSSTDARFAAVWDGELRRLPRLLQDLRYFEPRAVADLREATEAALRVADRLRLRSMEQPLALLGCLYVLEGSALGALVLRPMVARAFLLDGADGLAYLHGDAPAVHARWARYQQSMNRLAADLDTAECEQLVEGAKEFFAELETVVRALYPFQPESKTLLVTSINPEAGRHPVPADAGEVDAARQAAEQCWRQFPYFEHRYGERGRRFAFSDAAWLATLYQFEPSQILQQARWLGRVLAGRGMPTLLLQVQLEQLAAALSAAVPAKQAEYAKLSQAAAELLEARRRHLTDEQVAAVAAGFERAAGAEWRERFPHTGEMLACAVADELEGMEGAVESLQVWLADVERFPADWVAAVEAALAQARAQAR